MEQSIQIFKNEEFGEMRTLTINDQPYFVATDVCGVLGYANSRDAIARHVDEADVVKHDIRSGGQLREMAFVNESGLYALVFGSKLESARMFKRWVSSEVLPSIRKHGAFMTADTIEKVLSDPDTIIQLATTLKQERIEKDRYRMQVQLQEKELKAAAPIVNYTNKVLQSDDVLVTDQIAKEMGMTAVRLNKLLEQLGVQFRRNGVWVLCAKYADRGFTKSRTYPFTHRDGSQGSSSHTVWTEVGRKFIHELIEQYRYTQT